MHSRAFVTLFLGLALALGNQIDVAIPVSGLISSRAIRGSVSSLEIAFDSKPAQTVHKRDLLYSTGLEYSF